MKRYSAQSSYSAQSGFTLIEISIVVVVIALVIGALSYSNVLLRSSRVQAILTDVNQYKTAVTAFKMEYEALPGDLTHASDYWPHALDGWTKYVNNGGGSDSISDMNGNGDGYINNFEVLYAWLMLDVSGIAPGLTTKMKGYEMGFLDELNNILGVPSAHACYPVAPGSNIPPTQLDGGGYLLAHAHDPVYSRVDNAITVGKHMPDNETMSRMRGPLLTSVEARLLDTKTDNGVANTGEVVGANGTGTTRCVDNDEQYTVNDTDAHCFMVFWITKQ